MTLDAHVIRSFDRFDLDVTLAVVPGETIAVLGPNGAGKSTLLRCLAGLLPLDGGHIHLDGHVLDAPDDRDVFVPPERRPVGVVFQDHLLFPHLDACDNVAFGVRTGGARKRAARQTATAWLERVGMASFADRRPDQLSGGQRQRVALARALAPAPRLLLLDEPLAALDVGTRGEIRRELRQHLAGFDGIRLLVTHDPIDAYALADRVVVVESGRIVQQGTLREVTAHPRSRYVADLVGVNLLAGTAAAGVVTLASGAQLVAGEPVDGAVLAIVAPHSVAIYRQPPDGSPRNIWPATVTDLDHRADRVRVQLGGAVPLVAEITAGALSALALRPGDDVWAAVKATDVSASPA